MISEDGWGLSFPDICLTVDEKSRTNLSQENYLTGNRTRALYVRRNDVTPRPQRWSSKKEKKMTREGVIGYPRSIVANLLSNSTGTCMYICKVICPNAGLSLDMHYQGVHISVY